MMSPCLVLLLLYFNDVNPVTAVAVDIPGNFQIKLNGVEIQDETSQINVVEGTSPQLECNYKTNKNTTVVWDITFNGVSVGPTSETTVTIQNINRTQSILVRCETTNFISSEYRCISIDVQYPPGKPRISGPFVANRNTSFSLTCEVDSLPQATIWWTDEATYYAPKISEKSEISMNVTDNDDIVLYCIAYNVMHPSDGQPVQSSSVSAKRHILVKAEEAETPAPCNATNVDPVTHRFTPQSKQDVTTSTPRTDKRTILPTTIHVDGQNNPMVSSLSITNTKTKMTDKPYKEESMVKPVPSWQVGLVATSMCGWVVAAIAVIAAVALCCWSRRNRRGYKINTERTPEQYREATRNEYTPAPSHPTSFVPEVPTAPLTKPPSPKDGYSLRYQNMMQTDSPWISGRQSNLSSSDAKWREQRRSSTRQPYSQQETHYMNYPYSFVNDMVPYDDCIVPNQKTKLVIETTHV